MHKFRREHFAKFSEFIYKNYGISMNEARREILRNKLNKLMARHEVHDYDEYFTRLCKAGNGRMMVEFVDEITVNMTSFFRESSHFEYIKSNIPGILERNPGIAGKGEIRVWSAACSTGEEAYTLAMVLKEHLPEYIHVKVLATDISSRVLSKAQAGVYSLSAAGNVEYLYLKKYFVQCSEGYRISEAIRKLVTFRQFNLMESFPFRNSFDMVFCRNVMIYFDPEVRRSLLEKFYSILSPGGLLFIGHSESIAGSALRFSYVQPTIYSRN